MSFLKSCSFGSGNTFKYLVAFLSWWKKLQVYRLQIAGYKLAKSVAWALLI